MIQNLLAEANLLMVQKDRLYRGCCDRSDEDLLIKLNVQQELKKHIHLTTLAQSRTFIHGA